MIGALLAGYRHLGAELDEKFHESIDSVPTKIFSAVHWIRVKDPISLDELRVRLRERDYREVKIPNSALSAAQFQISERSDGGAGQELSLFLQPFEYPVIIREMLFTDAANVAGDQPALFHVYVKDGFVEKIVEWSSKKEFQALALEPVLVAQLNSSQKESRKFVPLPQVPHTLLKAIVSVEDQRFLEHKGIDPRGILRSMVVNLREGSYTQGASTITQQLIRNIYLSRAKTITRKVKEIVMALMLEMRFSKDEILEKYLNEVYLGQTGNISIHGVNQAAKFYFNKSLDQLSIAEQALITGLIRGPIFYSPTKHWERAKQRQEWVLKKMLENSAITQNEYRRAMKESLQFAKVSPIQDRAPYFTDYVKSQLTKDLQEQESELMGAGYKIFSTIDTYYQQIAERSVTAGIANLEATIRQRLLPVKKGNKKATAEEIAQAASEAKTLQGIFIALDPRTNHLLAMVGGRSYEESNYNRAILMRRQVGSIFKPFVYLAALMEGKNPDGTPMNAISKIEDKPFTYEYDSQTWTPQNYEEEFMGTVTLRFALANSINTVAAQLATQVGLQKVIDVAKAAGIETPLRAIPSISLGSIELPPMEVINSYATLANYGLRREVTSVLAIIDGEGKPMAKYLPKEEQTLPRAELANLVDMMRSVFTIGTAKIVSNALGFHYPAAGKTGTTNELRDAWFVGFTPRIIGLSWVGFDRDDEAARKQRKLLKLTGAVGALPIWLDFMKTTHKGIAVQDFQVPEGLIKKLKIDLISGALATNNCSGNNVVEEVFTEKNAPRYECR